MLMQVDISQKRLGYLFSIVIFFGFQLKAFLPGTSSNFHNDYYTHVQAFIDNDTLNYTYFYAGPNGEIVDSLKPSSKDEWIIVTIDTLKAGWAQLKDVFIEPSLDRSLLNSKLKSSWVPIASLSTSLPDPAGTFSVYVAPSSDSIKVVHPTVFGFRMVDIKGPWVKIKFTIWGIPHFGWRHKYDLCALPWTICHYPAKEDYE